MSERYPQQGQERILLVVDETPLSRGIEQLLNEKSLVVYVVPAGHKDELWEVVNQSRPTVIVFDVAAGLNQPFQLSEIFHFLPEVRLIFINWLDNQVQVIDKKMFVIESVEEILEVIV